MVDNLRFFAGAARCLEGRAAGEYAERLHLDDPPRGDRRGRPDRALELPADDGGVEDRAGPGRGQHGRPQAGRDDAADGAEAGRVRRRDLPHGRAQRDHRSRRSRRAGARHPSRCRHGLADRLGGDRQVDRPARRRHAQARPSRAWRQGSGRGVRRRRPRDRARDDRRHRLLQRRPGLHGRHPRARRRKGLRRRRGRSRRAGPGAGARGHALAPRPRSGPLNSARQRERVEGFLERRPSHAEVVTGGKRA